MGPSATRARHVTPFTTVGVVAHPERDCREVAGDIRDWATEHGIRILTLEGPSPLPAVGEPVSDAVLAASAELVIAAGGDGTILRALALAGPARVPVLGVNVGRLGFLAEVEPAALPGALAAITAGEFSLEDRLALAGHLTIDENTVTLRASNDLVLGRTLGRGQAAFAASVDGELFARYVGDGLIVSTPTGSTAYSLSAGGPIVAPMTQAILLTPIAPNGVFDRSLVIAPTETVRIDILEGSAPVALERDGQREREVPAGAVLEVSKSPDPGRLVRLGGMNFYGRARKKLRLADPPVLLSLPDSGP
jgi:NAD+ kinase